MDYRRPSFRVDRSDFVRGNNSYENFPDGGVTTATVGVNSWSKPGLLANAPTLGDSITASLASGGVVAWGLGKDNISLETIAVMVDGDQDGRFYKINELTGAFTLANSEDTTNNYQIGFTDIAYYQGKFYTTSKDDMVRHDSDLANPDYSYWVTTLSQSSLSSISPHPMVVYGDILYIADQNVLHKIDGVTPTADALDLGSDWVITAAAVYNNLIYIAAEPYWNASGGSHSGCKIFTWNGYSPSWLDEWPVDYRVNAFYPDKNGLLYIFTNQHFGYWTGSTFKPLRVVSNQIFKSQVAATADSLFYADGSEIIRYGTPLFGGVKRFFKYFSSADTFMGILGVYNNSLMITDDASPNSNNYFVSNVNTPCADSSNTFYFNKRRFKQPVKVRGAIIETEQLASGQTYVVKYYNDQNVLKTAGTFQYSDSNQAGKYTWAFTNIAQDATRSVKPVLVATGSGHVEAIEFVVEPVEDKFNR